MHLNPVDRPPAEVWHSGPGLDSEIARATTNYCHSFDGLALQQPLREVAATQSHQQLATSFAGRGCDALEHVGPDEQRQCETVDGPLRRRQSMHA